MNSLNAVVLIAIAFSLIYGLPHLIMIYYNGQLYNPIPVENAGAASLDEYPSAISLRDALDGNLIVQNPQIIEYKRKPGLLDFFPHSFLGIFGNIFGLNVFQILILLDFIFPAATFVALFLFLDRIIQLERSLAMLVSVLVLVFNSFVHLASSLLTLNIGYFDFTKSIDMFSVIPKFPFPEFTFIILIVSLTALYLTYKKDDVKYPLLTVIGGSLLLYSYMIHASAFWATVAVFSLFMLYENFKRNITKVALMFATTLLVSIPYLLNYMELSRSAAYADFLHRIGFITGRLVYSQLIHTVFALILLAIVYWLVFRTDRMKFYFLSAIVLGGLIMSNIQVVLGFTIQPDHWIIRVLDPMYFVLFAIILQEAAKKFGGGLDLILDKRMLSAATFIVLAWVFSVNTVFALNTHEQHKFSSAEADVYNWLNENTPLDSTVLTISIKENSHVSYTTHNTVYMPNGLITMIPSSEIADRILGAYRVFGVPEHELAAKLNVSNDALRKIYIDGLYSGRTFSSYDFEKYYFIHYFFHAQFLYGSRPYTPQNPDIPGAVGYYFPESFRNQLLAKYRNGSYTMYHYDYILVGPYEKQIANASIENSFNKVYSNDEFEIFAANV